MPAAKRLKVFRTAVGFHDAYVAAPSKKAALAAWGASKDLFAIGSAEIVTDPKLTKAPLAAPGQVIRLSRGGLAEQLAALPAERKSTPSPPRERPAAPKRTSKPKPRPSREKLEAIEAEQRAFEEEAEARMAELREREQALKRERAMLEKQQAAASEKLETKRAREKERYEAALAQWREA